MTLARNRPSNSGPAPQQAAHDRSPYICNIPLSVADFFALKRVARARVPEMLRAVGLHADLAEQRIGELSSGQFQRSLIAWALAGDPDVLLFDEPTSGISARSC